MPSLLTHPAVPLAVAAMAGRNPVPRPLLAAGKLDGVLLRRQPEPEE